MTVELLPAPRQARNRRRKYLLDGGYQIKYSLWLAALGAGGVLLVGGLAWQVLQEAASSPAEVLPVASETLLWLTGLGALGLALVLGLFGFMLTHRVAGPVQVMSLYVTTLAAGRYPRMRPLRKGDELRPFFDRFRVAVDRIREREAEEARLLAEALQALSPLATTTESRAMLEALAELHERKRQTLDNPPEGPHQAAA